MEKHNKHDETAFERYKIISPVLLAIEENADSGKIGLLKSEACGLAGVSRKTINRWLNRYAQDSIDGLKYQSGSVASRKLIPGELVKEAVLLRREVPSRSVPQIIEILEMEGKAPKGFLKRSTLQDRLREAGYAKAQMKLYQSPGIAARRFTRLERNDMWQADIKHCGFIKSKELYFVGFIDDATRYIIHGEFYHDFDQSIVEDSLRKAILKHGIPKRLYFDNGKQFRNKWMERACAVLDIKLIFTAPYSPEAKGKIERFNRTLDSFLAESDLKRPQDLSEINILFNVWLAECYHNKEHSGINTSPETAYTSSKSPLRFLPADTVARAFLRLEQRKVDKSGCISFQAKKYEVGVIYIGRTVDIVYDPADTSILTVEDNHFNTSFRIKELIIGTHTGPRPKLPEHMIDIKPETSRLLDEKQKRYEKHRLSAQRAISYAQINKEDKSKSDGSESSIPAHPCDRGEVNV
ncbi:MAG: DDE-type integrase/transposase/recombinase [Clostridiales bacterium]|jgi:transposase InsO family protein|nr:DDE-type integrase/transposase/recombinase [Clostridiales bacterium]